MTQPLNFNTGKVIAGKPYCKHAQFQTGNVCDIRKPGCLWGVWIDWRGVDCPVCRDMQTWNGPHEKETVPGDSAT